MRALRAYIGHHKQTDLNEKTRCSSLLIRIKSRTLFNLFDEILIHHFSAWIKPVFYNDPKP